MYDYARRYSPVIRGRQRVATRREGLASVGGRFWELAGSLMIGAIVVLLVSSIWCGWQIKSDQGALLLEKAQGRSLNAGHKQLVRQRDELASRERVEKMAAKILRLFPPAQDQIIRL